MNNDELRKFIAEKQKYEQESFTVHWIFEVIFLERLREIYGKKMLRLEERLDRIEAQTPKKLGDFLMCALAKKNFAESVKGK